jgi:hypothetical protein
VAPQATHKACFHPTAIFGAPAAAIAVAAATGLPREQTTNALGIAGSVGFLMSARRQVVPQNDIVSFVPLVPMTADELSGSFSIARVQIGQTQADVLLGEDGMARAIRVSTNERTSPGRLK